MKAQSVRGAKTKRRIVAVAAELFHRQGVHLTSPEEVIEASDTGKGQFYYYFKSKADLVHEVLQTELQAIKTATSRLIVDIKSWDDLERWLLGRIESLKRYNMSRGCLIGTIGSELGERDELIRTDLHVIIEVIHRKLTTFFAHEKASGSLASEANEAALAAFCLTALQGAALLGKVTRDSAPAEMVLREALAHVRRYYTAEAASGSRSHQG